MLNRFQTLHSKSTSGATEWHAGLVPVLVAAKYRPVGRG